jgi:hypothetical protein
MWTTNNPLDGSLCFGCYDQKKIIGQNHTQPSDYTATGYWTGMKVNIATILLNFRDGGNHTIFCANNILHACIVPAPQLLAEVPASIYESFENVTGTRNIGLSRGLNWDAHLFGKRCRVS